MIEIFVEGIGLRGPGLESWVAARPILSRIAPIVATPVMLPPPLVLPAAERRRVVPPVRLAIAVGLEALAQAGRSADGMATVFTSSGGDGETIQTILGVLATAEREVSPTRFHNSVHNAPSGYWTIAAGSRAPSTSLCAYDASFAAGLLEAGSQTVVDRSPVLLIAYDLPYPAPLCTVRHIGTIFGTAIALSDAPSERTIASLRVRAGLSDAPPTAMSGPILEEIRTGNPAARSLPLLAAIALPEPSTVTIEATSGTPIEISVTPT